MTLTAAEKLTILLLCQSLVKKKEERWIDPAFIEDAITSGNTWGIEHKYHIISDAREDASPEVVRETRDVLDMFRIIEASYGRLTAAEKERVDQTKLGFQWEGFDGNQEPHRWVADFMINKLHLYQEFGNRDLNSHFPKLEAYQRMLLVYRSVFNATMHGDLSADQIIAVISERIHPENRS